MRKPIAGALAAPLTVALALLLSQFSGGPGTVHAQGDVDLRVDWVHTSAPTDLDVSEYGTLTVTTTGTHTGAPLPDTVAATISHTVTAPTDCTVNGGASASDSWSGDLDGGASHDLVTSFTIHCSEPSTHVFEAASEITLDQLGYADPNPTNNTASTSTSVDAWAYADAKIDAMTVTAPASALADDDFVVTVDSTLHNNGPWHEVAVTYELSVSAPPGCTVTPDSAGVALMLPLSAPTAVSDSFTVNCSATGHHVIGVDSLLTLKAPHEIDPNPADNTAARSAPIVIHPQRDVYVLLVNGIKPEGNLRDSVVNDVDCLSAAFAQELRVASITTLGGSTGADSPTFPAALDKAIAAAFGPSGTNDLCIFYLGTHGYRVLDNDGDEDDGIDGALEIGESWRLDDDMDTPFNARLAAGDCGAGMILMFMSCHSGELIEGANDFALGAPHVVMTSCTPPQRSYACIVGHEHSCYGGAGLVRGLTSVTAAPPARADGGGMDVTAAELHAYAVANDEAPGSDPQSTAPASLLQALTYAVPAVHFSPVQQAGLFCDSGPLEQKPVGGIAEILVGGSEAPTRVAERSGSSSPLYAAIASAAALALSAGAWYARRRLLR